MMRVLSDTYPGSVKPVRNGWYLFSFKDSTSFVLREFLDGRWLFLRGEPIHQDDCGPWMALAFDPSEAIGDMVDAGTGKQGVFVPGATCC